MTQEATVHNQQPTPPAPSHERRERSLAELGAEQGIAGPQDFESLLGAGADLWDDDADFAAFLAALQQSRRSGD